MEIDVPNGACAYDGPTTASFDPLDVAIGFSPNRQLELLVNFSQGDLQEESPSEQSMNDDDDSER